MVLCWFVQQQVKANFLHHETLRHLQALHSLGQQYLRSISEANTAREYQQKLFEKILLELQEINTYLILPDQQREEKRLQNQAELFQRFSSEISLALAKGGFEEAEKKLAMLTETLGDDHRVEELRGKIRDAMQNNSQEVINNETQRAADLMSLARFDEAIGVARELQNTFPETEEVDSLLQRVQREARTFRSEQRKRLYEEINSAGEARQWKAALRAAHRLLETHPDSQEAGKVKGMLPMLVDNARIEEVRELRDRILDMIQRKRYGEAVAIADHVIENFPETTAAADLRQQLPKLRQLAGDML